MGCDKPGHYGPGLLVHTVSGYTYAPTRLPFFTGSAQRS